MPNARSMELTSFRTKHISDKSYQCNHCSKLFVRIGDFKRHLMVHSGEKPFKCNQCDKAFLHKSHLKVHLKIHTGEKPYKCSQCDKGFSEKSDLTKHARVHTGEKPYPCLQCDKFFSLKYNLKSHLRTHTGEIKERPYQCLKCDMAFPRNKDLTAHMRTHTGEKPFLCTNCGKSFSLKCNLVSHERIHTGEKPYQCDNCEKSFSDHSTLKRHSLIHTGHKAYQCTYCEKSFIQNANLLKHLKKHTGEKPYQCTHCDKKFITNNELKYHDSEHTGIKAYQCSCCDKAYATKSSLTLHQKIHTNDKPHKCTYCPKAFATRTHLKRHMATHILERKYPCNQLLENIRQCFNKTEDFSNSSIQNPEPKYDNISNEIYNSDNSSIPLFCEDPTEVLLWFQQNKLLKSVVSCGTCFNLINWSETSRSRDGFEWTCQTKDCIKYQQAETIRLGSFFDNSHVSIPDWFDVMFLWSENVKAKVTSNLVSISHKHVVDCYASFRKICQAYFMENPVKLGGPGINIEIDITRFPSNSENKLGEPIMVLGIVDSNSTPLQGYMDIIESIEAATLLPILNKVVEPGSVIYCKDAKLYENMQGLSESRKNVNDSVNFLDVRSSEHFQDIELFWERHNFNLSDICGYDKSFSSSYLQELLWRDRFYDDSFMHLCQHIAVQYPL